MSENIRCVKLATWGIPKTMGYQVISTEVNGHLDYLLSDIQILDLSVPNIQSPTNFTLLHGALQMIIYHIHVNRCLESDSLTNS